MSPEADVVTAVAGAEMAGRVVGDGVGVGVWFVEGSTRSGRVDPDCAKDVADEVKRSATTASATLYRKKLFFIGVSKLRD